MSQAENAQVAQRFIGYADLEAKGIKWSRQWLSKLIERGEFPAPLEMGAQTRCFLEHEVDAFIAQRIAERDQKVAARAAARAAKEAAKASP